MKLRASLAFCHDALVIALAWVAAYLLRFNFVIPAEYQAAAFRSLLWVVPVYALAFLAFGLYRGIWRYASLSDLRNILFALGVAALVSAAAIVMFQVRHVPRSVLVLHPLLLLLAMGGSRFAYRYWKEHRSFGEMIKAGEPALVLGAGDGGVQLLRELQRSESWRAVGLLDDDPAKQGRSIYGVRVLGRLDDFADVAERFQIKKAIVAMPSAAHSVRRRVTEMCSAAGVSVLTVPSFDDLISGRVAISKLRRIEVEDLLGRDPVALDDGGLRALFAGKTVLITGAGGSIGSELSRQVARFAPQRLVLLELSEFALYRVEQEFAERFPDLAVECIVGDVKDAARLRQVFSSYQPDVVLHAAAYKHVPLMEQRNAWEAVRNNVLGTLQVARVAQEFATPKFVLISTDKAVNPTNVMGASKRLAEMACQSLQRDGTRFVTVRFGNVLGSNGSVIPKFREQIARGGPVTVTHPEITRFFMTIPEAAQLVLQAGLMGQGGEIFVLEMGDPVKIADLARDMIRLSGYRDHEIKIVYTGLRPGEKLYEEVLADREQTLATPHPKLRIAKAREVPSSLADALARWFDREEAPADEHVRRSLKRWVPEYKPFVEGVQAEVVPIRQAGRRA